MSSLELCLFRHGRTVWNALGKYQGHADVDLDELGRRQAVAVGDRAYDMRPVALYSSDLRRCTDTAAQINKRTGLEIRTDKRLRERDVGGWSGRTRDEISVEFADEYKLWTSGEEVRPGGGETTADMLIRIREFLDEIVSTYSDGTVVAVSHGGWIKAAAQWVLTGRIDRIGLGIASQGALTVFSRNNGAWRVEAYNDRGHLASVEPVDQEPPAAPIY